MTWSRSIPSAVTALLDAGRIPVVATVARGRDGLSYNVNADTAAAALAVALQAEKLDRADRRARAVCQLADTHRGHRRDRGRASWRELLPAWPAGMVPKMEACLRAVEAGVPRATVLDGRELHALLLEIFTTEGIGTMVLPDGVAE